MTLASGGVPRAPESRPLPGDPGLWVLIWGELLIFSAFFVILALAENRSPQVFAEGRALLNRPLGLANTLLLLTSSAFAAAAVTGARLDRREAPALLGLSILGGAMFVAIKIYEYWEKLSAGQSVGTNEFLAYYFGLTILHLVHVLIGLAVMTVALVAMRRASRISDKMMLIESAALFWHLVDILWIVLFAMLYIQVL